MNVSGLSVKEAMEAIEERIPLGRWIVKIVLFLAVLAIIVWLCKFLYHDLVSPLTSVAYSWFSSGNVKLSRETLANFISAVFLGALFFILSHFLSANLLKIAREILERGKVVEEHVATATKFYQETLSEAGTFNTVLGHLEERVQALEGQSENPMFQQIANPDSK
jgi:1,4-dihydroxy-2-naphthoate octaprenyltransferase